jgi:hypothetical protein
MPHFHRTARQNGVSVPPGSQYLLHSLGTPVFFLCVPALNFFTQTFFNLKLGEALWECVREFEFGSFQ